MKYSKLPSDWRLIPLSSVADVQTGLALGEQAKVDPVRLPYLRVANVQDGFLNLKDIKDVVIERSKVPRYSLQRGDVLMTEGGDNDKLGRGFVWHGEIPNCLHQNHVFVVRPHAELLSYFLAALTSSDYGRSYFQNCSKQSTNLASINSSQLKAFPVPLPDIQEQEAIRAVLSAWDRALQQVSDLIAAKLRFKHGLMQQLLTGKGRFRKFADAWETRIFGSFLTESRIHGSSGAKAKKLTIRLYGKGVCPKKDSRPGSEATKFYERRAGQFIYSKLDFLNGAFAIVPSSLDGYQSSQDLPAFDIDESIDPRWLIYFVTRPGFYRNQLGLAHGGRKARRVNPTEFLKLSIPIPGMCEQTCIADALETLDRQLDLLKKQLDALKKQKKGLMQKLLTGQVWVKLPKGGA